VTIVDEQRVDGRPAEPVAVASLVGTSVAGTSTTSILTLSCFSWKRLMIPWNDSYCSG
jgi:hypothetical protein